MESRLILRMNRVGNDLTVRQLGKLSGVHPSAISCFEKGRRFPTKANAILLCKALGFDKTETKELVEKVALEKFFAG